ncbi:hypothetical protein AJ79_03947 [Helicocarpus griseus UAMH5409]|uniref:AMP-dependent synthetase/ligase domain-containing protein n=1 Tax=Helicocarpus griseus UAMH5409 TaxID=1447875 RepID=A0A2B7XMH7_9EURO|nr:hypothetical protein AJ79_03947 [Helicocarpus griseus UAMH5409]
MTSEDNALATVDALLSDLLAGWSIHSTLIATLIAVFVGYKLFFTKDPDAHPYFLARQAVEAPVRLPGESAVLRAHDVPHGYPLKSGLNVKDADKPKWTAGRNGDLRDIWRAALRGSLSSDGAPAGKQGKFYTVLGKHVAEHKLDDVSQEMNVIGQYIYELKSQTVAVYLPDSVESLATVFAGAFYGFKTVLIPRKIPSEKLGSYLALAGADLLIAEAGTLEISTLLKGVPSLKGAIWVANHGSRHMDWSQVPEGIGGDIEVAVWHELVKDKKGVVGTEVPASISPNPPPIVTLWASSAESGEFVEYSPANLVAGIAGVGSVLPRGQHLTSSDLVLSIDSLSRSYPLCILLAALYVNASIAFNSASGEHVDFALATAGISPTVIVASSETMHNYYTKYMAPQIGLFAKFGRFLQRRSLDAGTMPKQNILTQLTNLGPTAELSLEKLRLLFISHRIDTNPEYQLTSDQLSDLRVFTGARVLYALTAPTVVGAVAQTNVYDYRRLPGRHSHFGAPMNTVEVKLVYDKEEDANDDTKPTEGKIFVAGPAVVGGKGVLDARGYIGDDYTLSLS